MVYPSVTLLKYRLKIIALFRARFRISLNLDKLDFQIALCIKLNLACCTLGCKVFAKDYVRIYSLFVEQGVCIWVY